MDNDVAKEMNRELFLAPELIEDDDEGDPLLDQARRNVADEVEEAEERRKGDKK